MQEARHDAVYFSRYSRVSSVAGNAGRERDDPASFDAPSGSVYSVAPFFFRRGPISYRLIISLSVVGLIRSSSAARF